MDNGLSDFSTGIIRLPTNVQNQDEELDDFHPILNKKTVFGASLTDDLSTI